MMDSIPFDKKFIAKCSDGVDRVCVKYKKSTFPHWTLIKVLEEYGVNVEGESGFTPATILSYKLI